MANLENGFISLEDLNIHLEKYMEQEKMAPLDATILKQIITNYDKLKQNNITGINVKDRLGVTYDGEIISLDSIILMNEKENKDKKLEEKGRAYVMKKAGFLDMGMLIDVLIISVAIILLIMIILGTR